MASSLIHRKTVLGIGALAAGVALVHRSDVTNPFTSVRWQAVRHMITPPQAALPPFLHRSQSSLASLFSSITSAHDPTMASLTPPQPAPKWTHTAQEIVDLTKAAIAKHKEVEDKIAALSPVESNFESVRLGRS